MTAGGERPEDKKVEELVPTRVVVGRRSWAVPAIGVVALAIVLVGFLGQKPVIPPRPSSDETPSPSPSAAPVGIAWTEVPLDLTTFERARVGLVIGGPQGVLALGQDGLDRHPISWTSPDGRTWTRHDQPPATFGGGVPDRATAGGPGFIALGYHASADGTTREVWTSPDGATWTRAQSSTGRGFTAVTALAGAGGTAVLVADVDGRQALLSSRDGQVWAETPDLDATLGRNPYIFTAVGSGSGYLAVGAIGDDETALWRSDDGHDWTPVAPAEPTAIAKVHLFHLFRTHAGFLATGYSDDPFGGQTTGWESHDGVAWAVVPSATAFGVAEIAAVHALKDADLSVSGDQSFGGGFTTWTLRVSVDLGSWFEVAPPTRGPVDWSLQATVVDDRLVVLGWDAETNTLGEWSGGLVRDGLAAGGASPAASSSSPRSGGSPAPTPGIKPPSIPASPLAWHRLDSESVFEDPAADLSITGAVHHGSDVIAFGSVGSSAGLWRSADANHWQRLPIPPTMRGARIQAMTNFEDRLVAIGAIAAADGSSVPAAWTSENGISWTRAKGAPGSLGVELRDVAAGPHDLVAVGRREGEQGPEAVVWTSMDGSTWSQVPPVPGSVFGVGYSDVRAIAYGHGGFVAVGRSDDGSSNGIEAVWTSADGRTWTKVDVGTAFGSSGVTVRRGVREAVLTDVVWADPWFVAVGSFVGRSATVGAIFRSRDGTRWTRDVADTLLEASEPSTVTTWSGGLGVGGNVVGFGGGHPAVWTSVEGGAWVSADVADLAARGAPRYEILSALIGVDRGLIGVGSAARGEAHVSAGVWVGARSGEVTADHVCPTRIDSLAVLATMTGADRSACLGAVPVKVAALARAGTNECGEDRGVPDLSGCGTYLELAPIEGGSAMLTVPLDASQIEVFIEGFRPWTIALRTGLVRETCLEPVPAPNGVVYEPGEAVILQCQAVLRVVGQEPLVRR